MIRSGFDHKPEESPEYPSIIEGGPMLAEASEAEVFAMTERLALAEGLWERLFEEVKDNKSFQDFVLKCVPLYGPYRYIREAGRGESPSFKKSLDAYQRTTGILLAALYVTSSIYNQAGFSTRAWVITGIGAAIEQLRVHSAQDYAEMAEKLKSKIPNMSEVVSRFEAWTEKFKGAFQPRGRIEVGEGG